jgi:hypothetical protein
MVFRGSTSQERPRQVNWVVRRRGPMQPTFRVVVNRTDERRIAEPADIDRLCADLAGRPVFTADVLGERGYAGPTLDLIAESGRAHVFFLDIDRGIKRVSRDETCTQRGCVSLRNDAYPDLQLDQVEVHRRDLIPPARALAILRHYLATGEVVGLVSWPSEDEDEWGDAEVTPDSPGEEIPL